MIMAVQQKVKTKRKHKCPPHYWIIDSSNVGHCKYCPEVSDFGMLLQKQGVFVAAARRGADARKEVLDKRGKSAAAKERWQDPEYRAKQSVAMKGRCHKKEEIY